MRITLQHRWRCRIGHHMRVLEAVVRLVAARFGAAADAAECDLGLGVAAFVQHEGSTILNDAKQTRIKENTPYFELLINTFCGISG